MSEESDKGAIIAKHSVSGAALMALGWCVLLLFTSKLPTIKRRQTGVAVGGRAGVIFTSWVNWTFSFPKSDGSSVDFSRQKLNHSWWVEPRRDIVGEGAFFIVLNLPNYCLMATTAPKRDSEKGKGKWHQKEIWRKKKGITAINRI